MEHVTRQIRAWIAACIDERCFCPEDGERHFDESNNVVCYLSSPGTESGAINQGSQWRRVLRVPIERNPRPVEQSVGSLIYKVFGDELQKFCQLGKEENIVHHMLRDLMGRTLDLRPLMWG